MKITKVILVCNDNSHYYQFANDVYDIWKYYIGLEPHLFIITDNKENIKLDLEDRKVQYIKPIKDIPTAFQSQVIRLLLPCLFENDTILITDIDMVPLHKKIFKKYIKYLNDDIFIQYFQNYQICYNCATGIIWKDIFKINSITQIKSLIQQWYIDYKGSHTTDQMVLHKYLTEYKGKKLILTSYLPSRTVIKRLSTYTRPLNFHKVPLEELKDYIDFHAHHVFKIPELIPHYKNIVQYLLSKIN